ncbi:MAG: M15 family metallopeptidase [Verrucomicrobia bacterium]|nr:M15 family metallopeptidase [Verrucomicrobiota bacterium]
MTKRRGIKPLPQLRRSLGIPANYGVARGMPAFREAKHVVRVGRDPNDGKPVRLTPAAARAWRRMRDAAAADGITLLPLSGFRSIARQTRLIRRNLAKGRPMDDLLRYIAAPGYSEHHTGRAIDIGDPTDTTVEESFARTPAYRWLKKRAHEFGFVMTYPRGNRHGIGYEPWHWCWHARS